MGFTTIILDKTDYLHALNFQESLFQAQLDLKAAGNKTNNYLILCEHYPVYTLGKSGDLNNLKVPIEETGADFHHSSRGGDITFHGPGQLVIYPIFDYGNYRLSTKEYVYRLEECMIDFLKHYNLNGERMEQASGVWLDTKSNNARKICAIGLKVSKHISMHGLALNIATDLSFFDNIIPCGLEDKAVTSLENERGKAVDFVQARNLLIQQFENHF